MMIIPLIIACCEVILVESNVKIYGENSHTIKFIKTTTKNPYTPSESAGHTTVDAEKFMHGSETVTIPSDTSDYTGVVAETSINSTEAVSIPSDTSDYSGVDTVTTQSAARPSGGGLMLTNGMGGK